MKPLMIVLAYNEEGAIENVVKTLKVSKYDFIVVNDASSDNTAKVAAKAGATVISHQRNLGPVGGMQTGIKYAMRNKYDVVMQFDGDGQHLVEEVDKVLALVEQGADIGIGSRFKDGIGFEHSTLKTMGRTWLSMWIKLLSGIKITDPSSGFRAYRIDVAKHMIVHPNVRPETDSLPVFANAGYKIKEVHVKMNERETGESFLTPINAIKHMVVTTMSMIILNNIKLGDK